ncbi:hypothetical protein CIW49_26335 [Mycolicibacterium sp. P1-18]|uniref:hypothetical protein n=1 Tax=Mycolicibacterium sp. P1-18 TaxID=2024615 RepID=UPI0011F19694|nr:hypothetical protein [Mycolicibacterium sp. P1-18]KAA0093583.1 hypothetical protein CIW49_26335 [Mycolicibacterium sp. P1-18]
MDIDYALRWHFVDATDGRPRQLRFRCTTENTTGQLLAVIADPHRDDSDDVLALTRPDVAQAAVDAALDGWHTWARLTDDTLNLTEIRRRIHAAGLD